MIHQNRIKGNDDEKNRRRDWDSDKAAKQSKIIQENRPVNFALFSSKQIMIGDNGRRRTEARTSAEPFVHQVWVKQLSLCSAHPSRHV